MGNEKTLGSLKELKKEIVVSEPRFDKRVDDEMRVVKFSRRYLDHVPGSVLVSFGRTKVLCTVSSEDRVPRWLSNQSKGWLTAEYSMLPASTATRKDRDISRGKLDGRSSEIQRLIGRSLRNIIDFKLLGERTLWVDCDVIQADGGTRTASITGAYVALVDACHNLQKKGVIKGWPLRESLQAVSVGVVSGRVLLDLNYDEDSRADVDLNLVMTGSGNIIELQGTGEKTDFDFQKLERMLEYGKKGCRELATLQEKILK